MIAQREWAAVECLLDVSRRFQFTDGGARCLSLAICNAAGESSRRFEQGETLHLYYEFEALRDLGVPAGGAELVTPGGVVVHGKATYQAQRECEEEIPAGARVRFHQAIALCLAPGRYRINVGLGSTDREAQRAYRAGEIGYLEFVRRFQEHCRLVDAAEIEVVLGASGWLSHHGLADLPGSLEVEVLPRRTASPGEPPRAEATGPTVFHVTHWKAGSQWIYAILRACFPDRIIEPRAGNVQVLHYPIQRGFIYPTVYLPRPRFEALGLPENSRWFVIIRDLRDTLVSAYFSFKISHPVLDSDSAALRQKLWDLDQEGGFLYLMDNFLQDCAAIQLSWLEAGEPLIRYEDLLERDVELLSQL
ncbi:MAG: Wzt carbohydrate-binding domain-containing protein, partial [Bryobacterales bacterium]|nr:Wzt carbohydrate-binding domain-containing protein [Bryobacteraceae bacterium]MDW8130809.1 Wzt carbohydrate-binding domain-containing protein [Bryobacterales bacterium]